MTEKRKFYSIKRLLPYRAYRVWEGDSMGGGGPEGELTAEEFNRLIELNRSSGLTRPEWIKLKGLLQDYRSVGRERQGMGQ